MAVGPAPHHHDREPHPVVDEVLAGVAAEGHRLAHRDQRTDPGLQKPDVVDAQVSAQCDGAEDDLEVAAGGDLVAQEEVSVQVDEELELGRVVVDLELEDLPDRQFQELVG